MPRLHFHITPPIDRSHDPVAVLLEEDSSGGGVRILDLVWEPPCHTGEIAFDGAGVNFRIVRSQKHVAEVDASGRRVEKRTWVAAEGGTVRISVADWEDRLAGTIERVQMTSRILGCERELIVWLPPSYFKNPASSYPLVVGFDGRRLFDPATSPSGIDWALDEWVGLLSRRGVMPECIAAGIVEPAGFCDEGISLRDAELSLEQGGETISDFVVSEVLPFLDQHYRTTAVSTARTLIGSGLGGLRTFWTVLRHPSLFGSAACLSTSFEDLSQSLPANARCLVELNEGHFHCPGAHIYFDHGDTGLDECYGIYHTILAGILREQGWECGRDFEIRQASGGSHDDQSWRCRIGDALQWMARQTSR